MKKLKDISVWLPLLITVFSVFFSYQTKPYHLAFLESDAYGYYSYIPALVFDENQSYDYSKEKESYYFYKGEEAPQHYLNTNDNGKKINKYFAGTSLLCTPFFIGVHLVVPLTNFEQDGYSVPYQFLYYFAAICYFFLGLLLLFKLLRNLKIKSTAIILTVLLVGLGTNLLYASFYRVLSHTFSFFAITLFVFYLSHIKVKGFKPKSFFIIGLLLGLVFLIRPVNLTVILVLPFFIEVKYLLKFKHGLLAFFGGLILVVLQIVLWKITADTYMFKSYTGESLYFFNPHIYEPFFGPHVGLILYMPSIVLFFIGVYYGVRKDKKHLYFLLFFVLTMYVVVSWWSWSYSSDYGMRPITDFLGIISIPIAFALNRIRNVYGIVLTALFILINLKNTYQFSYGIMRVHAMTSYSKYFQSFLKLAKTDMDYTGECIEAPPIGILGEETKGTIQFLENKLKGIDSEEIHIAKFMVTSPYKVGRVYVKFSFDVKNISEDDLKGLIVTIGGENVMTQDVNAYTVSDMNKGSKENIRAAIFSADIFEGETLSYYLKIKSNNGFKDVEVDNFRGEYIVYCNTD